MRRSLRNELIAKALYAAFWVFLFLVSSMPFSRGMTLWESFQLAAAYLGWLLPMTFCFILVQIGSLAVSFAGFSQYVRRLRAGRPSSSGSVRSFVVRHTALDVLGALLLVGLAASWFAVIPRTVPLEDAPGGEHIIRLEQLDPDAVLFVGTGSGGLESGTVDYCDVPLTSFVLDSQQLSEPNASSPSLFQHYIEVLLPVDVQAAARALARKSFLYDAAPVDPSRLPEGVEFALMNNEYDGIVSVCVVSGNRILTVQYIGGSASAETVLREAANALLA